MILTREIYLQSCEIRATATFQWSRKPKLIKGNRCRHGEFWNSHFEFRMVVAPNHPIKPAHDQEAAADAEEARGQSGQDAQRRQLQHQAPGDVDRRIAFRFRTPQHGERDGRHRHGEEQQQPLAIDRLGQARPDEGAQQARPGEHRWRF